MATSWSNLIDLIHILQDGVNWLAFLRKYKLHGILCDGILYFQLFVNKIFAKFTARTFNGISNYNVSSVGSAVKDTRRYR